MGFIHADLMAQYAEDAKVHDEPWEFWQHGASGIWVDCVSHPGWCSDSQYRRKPRSIKSVEDGWLQDGPLLYRLTDEPKPRNRDEIIVAMVNSSRTEEARTWRAGELLDAIRAAAEIGKAMQ